jgi:transposase-like protein
MKIWKKTLQNNLKVMKEVKKVKVIKIFPQEDVASKILYNVSMKMNERHSR